MANEVEIKSNRYGLNLILDDQTPFPELLRIIGNKFQETGGFFKDAKMAVSFEGRELSPAQQKRIADVIMENSSIRITRIMEAGALREEKPKPKAQAEAAFSRQSAPVGEGNADFYKGNLRSGQILESESNITLIGDVNPGANIISGGSIVILGSLKGTARGGASGDDNCFIFALDMRPIQLQIGEFIAKSPDRDKEPRRLRRKEKEGTGTPKVAVVRDGNICVEPMTKGFLDRM